MPTYILHCPGCKTTEEKFLKVSERHGARCECGETFETAAEQFSTVGIASSYKRGERVSRSIAFQEAGIPEVKADCPSMDFKVRNGEAVPVYHDDNHQRRCFREMNAASKKYKAERDAKVAARRKKIDKGKAVQSWLKGK